MGVYRYIYPPKIRPGKFLWRKNDVWLMTLIYTVLPPQNKFLATPLITWISKKTVSHQAK